MSGLSGLTDMLASHKGAQRLTQSERIARGDGSGDEFPPGELQALIETLGTLHAGVRTLSGNLARGAIPRVIVNGQSVRLSNVASRVAGYAIRETSGTAGAVVRLLDGFDSNGDLLVPINLSANESVRDWFQPTGISYGAGLYVQVVSGTIEGTVFLAPDARP